MRTFLVLFFVAAPVLALAAPADSNDLSLISMTLKMLAALGVVVGLFLLLYALARKSRTWLPGAAAQDAIHVCAVRHLGPKKSLYLVDVDGHRFFISAAGEQIRLLSEWGAPQADSDGASGAPDIESEVDKTGKASFAALMQRQFKGKKSPAQNAGQSGATAETQENKSCPEA